MVKDGNYIKIGQIENHWSWEYDSVTVTAKLLFDPKDKNNNIFLDISRVHTKTGLGKGQFKKHIGRFDVGTLRKPQKRLITSILSKHKQQYPFGRNSWKIEDKSELTLKEIFDIAYENNNKLSRALKINELKRKLNG